ncbi:hypothetical protein P9209_30015 (plasmid) [Prescottella defluvii]|nr:hypothetical protein P9209_30015 [Prescottella defluvii]
MNIASIDRGIYTTVEVEAGSSLITIETGNILITFNGSETEQLIQALQQAIKELPEEPKYVVVLPSNLTARIGNTFTYTLQVQFSTVIIHGTCVTEEL